MSLEAYKGIKGWNPHSKPRLSKLDYYHEGCVEAIRGTRGRENPYKELRRVANIVISRKLNWTMKRQSGIETIEKKLERSDTRIESL